MKSTYRRLIKILSCSLAIAAVLLCSVCMPALAAPSKILKPADYLYQTSVDNGIISYSFRFMQNPYYELYNESTLLRSHYGDFSWSTDTSFSYYRISMSPLGTPSFNEYADCMIDVTDFKVGTVLDVSATAQFYVEVSSEGSSNLSYLTRSQMVLYWFDSNFKLLSSKNTSIVEKEGRWGQNYGIWVLQNSFDIEIPENASYLIPRYIVQIFKPDAGAITKIQSTDYEYFDINVTKEEIRDDSVLLERIDQQLGDLNDQVGDLNDKADTIISGSDEMQDQASDFKDNATNAENEMEDLIGDLEDLPDVDLNDIDLSFADMFSNKEFTYFGKFFAYLTLDALWIKMMVIVCTFIWISTLLFGKRG